MKTTRLAADDRGFLEAVSRATFANPFSREREDLDLAIAGGAGRVTPGGSLPAVLERVRAFIARQDGSGRRAIGDFDLAERALMEEAYLFDLFHAQAGAFDRLIEEQMSRGEECCRAPFARQALGEMIRRGIEGGDAERYFAVFYQLRRAYFFICGSLAGRSDCMRRLRLDLWNSVFTCDTRLYVRHLWNRLEDFSTLLLGETGTGKGAAAAAIGRSGFIPFDRDRNCFPESFVQSFVAINLSQFPEGLIESELFGHRRGAFTGAVDAHEGVFARCSPHGAIFLDEIGDVSVPVQIKLLKVLQEREFSPVGSHERKRFSGRVIAASNQPIDDLRASGRFRDDFFYRLSSDVIRVPPLRQRLAEDEGELDDLLEITLQRIVGRPADFPALIAFVKDGIRRAVGPGYDWPGNVRELEQCVRRMLVSHSFEGDGKPAGAQRRFAAAMEAGGLTAQQLLQGYCHRLYGLFGTYEEVARRTRLDRRTVKKYVANFEREAG